MVNISDVYTFALIYDLNGRRAFSTKDTHVAFLQSMVHVSNVYTTEEVRKRKMKDELAIDGKRFQCLHALPYGEHSRVVLW
jgi:hypothetical protein